MTTLQENGQFYVGDIDGSGKDIPIDNFLFITEDDAVIKFERSGEECFISCWSDKDPDKVNTVKCKDTATALRYLADILDGTIEPLV